MTYYTGDRDTSGGNGLALVLLLVGMLAVFLFLGLAFIKDMGLPTISSQPVPTLSDEAMWGQLKGDNGYVLTLALEDIVNTNGDHAVKKHGPVALAIARSCSEHGPEQVYRATSWREPNKFILGCILPDGKWGAWIVRCTAKGWMWITSFVVKSGTKAEFVEYATTKARPWREVIPDCG